jgi:hypothetical protein
MVVGVLMLHCQRMDQRVDHLYGQLYVVRVEGVVQAVGQHFDLLYYGCRPFQEGCYLL